MLHLDWRFLPVFDPSNLGTEYVGTYDPILVATSVVIAILAAFVALSISSRIAAAQSSRARSAWISAGAVVMGGGIWAMHFIGMLAFSLPCGTSYNPLGTLASVIPGILASGVALSVIGRRREPSLLQLLTGAVLMGAGIGVMHYSGMAAMEPEALLRYDPVWAATSVVVAVALAFLSLGIRFYFARGRSSSTPATIAAAAVMGCGVACMHYTAMRASLFFPQTQLINVPMNLSPTTLAVVITIVTVLIASITLVASFAGRQVELALELRAEIIERERGQSELIKARHQAEEANLAKSQFLATMSHEIRTPLNGVIGIANLLASTPLNERQGRLVDNLARSGRTLLALINDILDFSRIEAQELDLFEAPFEIREVIAEVTDLFAEQSGSKNLELVYSVADDVPAQLLGDAVRLRQILINLIGNAMKFTERGEIIIDVSLAHEEDGALTLAFSVADTGIGIAREKLDQVFEPFRQVDASMTRSRGGSGLGLAITKHLVELMGGRIRVESELNSGSRFLFTTRVRRTVSDTPRATQQVARPLRTLLVDTNAASACVIHRYLASWKIAPTVVATAPEAMTTWRESVAAGTPFDVAVIDLKGLGAEGVELARAIRAEGRAAGTEIILLVGINNLADNDDTDTIGALATFTKPARPSALFDCFSSIASGAGRQGIAPLMSWRAARGAVPCFDAQVLVVEDNPVNQEVVTGILGNMDCRVVTAVNGRSAVELFSKQDFDLVLMDCEMPVMDGFEAACRIREVEAARAASADGAHAIHTPIVALTAHALAEIRERCLHSGMDDFLVKPFDELQITEMLRQWIPGRERTSRDKLASSAPPQLATRIDVASAAHAVIDIEAIKRIQAIPGSGGATLFERVVSQFNSTAPALAAAIREQYEAGDADVLWRTAHSLKSSAATLGAERVARCCAQIESLARDAGVKAVGELVRSLEAELAAAQDGLRELIGAEHV